MKHTRCEEIAEDKTLKGMTNYTNININVILELSMQELDIYAVTCTQPSIKHSYMLLHV